MRTISENFKIIIDKQNLLGYNFPKLLQEPADKSLIRHAEDTLNLKFNSELHELYGFANGIKIDYDNVLPLGKIGLIPIHIFLDLNNAINYYTTYININDNSFSDSFLNLESGYKPGSKLFPFLHDSAGNCYWVDLNNNTENYGKIFWTNTFGEEPGYTFNSLTSMFQGIAESYENNVMTVDEEKNLECHYKEWYRISKKNNPGTTQWDTYLNE